LEEEITLPLESQVNAGELAAIGLVIAEWSAIERALLYVLSGLLVADAKTSADYAPAVFMGTGMGYRVLLGLIRAIVEIEFPTDVKEFDKIMEDLQKSADKRDFLAHNPWSRSTEKADAIGAVRLKTVGGVKSNRLDYTAKEIRAIALEMHQRYEALVTFLKHRGAWRNPPQTLA